MSAFATQMPANFVVVDCETSGLSSERHALLSIGAVTASGREFYRECLFDERRELDAAAMAVNGINLGLVNADDEFPDEAVLHLCEWLIMEPIDDAADLGRRWIMGGKNPQFDYGFLLAAAETAERQELLREKLSRRCVDLHSLAYDWAIRHGIDFTARDFSTEAIYGLLGFQPEPKPHNALAGARLEMEIFRRLWLV